MDRFFLMHSVPERRNRAVSTVNCQLLIALWKLSRNLPTAPSGKTDGVFPACGKRTKFFRTSLFFDGFLRGLFWAIVDNTVENVDNDGAVFLHLWVILGDYVT